MVNKIFYITYDTTEINYTPSSLIYTAKVIKLLKKMYIYIHTTLLNFLIL